MEKCEKCGAEVELGFDVCWSCGASVRGTEAIKAEPPAPRRGITDHLASEGTSEPALGPRAAFRVFRSSYRSWQTLFAQAAEFATLLGPRAVISISHSEDANEGVVTVWYWNW